MSKLRNKIILQNRRNRYRRIFLLLQAYKGVECRNKGLLGNYLRTLRTSQMDQLDLIFENGFSRWVNDLSGKGEQGLGDILSNSKDISYILEKKQSGIMSGGELFKSDLDYSKDVLESIWYICKEFGDSTTVGAEVAMLCIGVIRTSEMLELDKLEAEKLVNLFFGTKADSEVTVEQSIEMDWSIEETDNIIESTEEERQALIELDVTVDEFGDRVDVNYSMEDLIEAEAEEMDSLKYVNLKEWEAESKEDWSFINIGNERYITDGMKVLNWETQEWKMKSPFWKRLMPKLTIRLRRKVPEYNLSKSVKILDTFRENWILNIFTMMAVFPAIIEMYPHFYNRWVQYISIPYRGYMRYNHTADYVLSGVHNYLDVSLLLCKMSYICLIGVIFYILYIYKIPRISIAEYIIKRESIFLIYFIYIWLEYTKFFFRGKVVNTGGGWKEYLRKIVQNTNPYILEHSYDRYKVYTYTRYNLFIEQFINSKLKVKDDSEEWQRRLNYSRPGMSTNTFTWNWLNEVGQQGLGGLIRDKVDYRSVCNSVLRFMNFPYRFEGTEVEISLREKYRWRLKQRYYYGKLRGHLKDRMVAFKERVERQYMFYPDYYYLGGYVGNSIRCLDDLEGYDKVLSSYYRQALSMFIELNLKEPVRLNELRDWYDAHANSIPYCPWNGNLRRVWRKEVPIQKFDGKRGDTYDYWYKENIAYPYMEEINLYERQHIGLVGKRLRYKQWETEDPNNFINTGGIIIPMEEEGDARDIRNFLKSKMVESNSITKHFYVIYNKYIAPLWEKYTDEMDDFFDTRYIKLDLRRSKKLYRWRNEVEYSPSSYGSQVRAREIYDIWGYALPQRIGEIENFTQVIVPMKLDLIPIRERVVTDERKSEAKVLEILEDMSTLMDMGLLNRRGFRDFERWLKYEYLQEVARERVLLKKEIRKVARKRRRIFKEFKGDEYVEMVGGCVGKNDSQMEKELLTGNWSTDNTRLLVWDMHDSQILFRKVSYMCKLLGNRGLSKRYKPLKRLRFKGSGSMRMPYMETRWYNYFIDSQILRDYVQDGVKRRIFTGGDRRRLRRYWRRVLVDWKHRGNRRTQFSKAMEMSGVWPCKDNSNFFEKEWTQQRFFSAEERWDVQNWFNHGQGRSRWLKRRNSEPVIPWGRKTITGLDETEILSHTLWSRSTIKANLKKVWLMTSLAKEEEVLGVRLGKVSSIERNKLSRLSEYIQSLYDEVERRNRIHLGFGPKDVIQEFKYIFTGSGSRPKSRRFVPNEGPGLDYYYKDLGAQFKLEEVEMYYIPQNLRLIVPGEMEHSKRVDISKYFSLFKRIRWSRKAKNIVRNRKGAIKNVQDELLDKEESERWNDNSERKIIRSFSEVRNKLAITESDLICEMYLGGADFSGFSLSKYGELSEAFHSYIQAQVGRRKNVKWNDSMYPWETPNMMGGNYRYTGGPIVIGSQGYVWDYNGRGLTKDILMRNGIFKRWEIQDGGDEQETAKLRATRHFEDDWKRESSFGNMEDETSYFGIQFLDFLDFTLDRTKYERGYVNHLLSSIYSHSKRADYEMYVEEGGLREGGSLMERSRPGELEGYRYEWLKEREGIAYRKAGNKKYDYYYYNNPIPQEYYTIGREYWMPSKLYLEDPITDVDKIDREIIAYEIHRYLLLRYDFPLEVLIVNALTGFDIGTFILLIF